MKRNQMIDLLWEWTQRAIFNLRDVSSPHGSYDVREPHALHQADATAILRPLERYHRNNKRWYRTSKSISFLDNELALRYCTGSTRALLAASQIL
jgi:hypothetical protein